MTLRKETLRAMAGSYLNISISVPTFQTLLGFNTPVEAEAFATEAGLRILTEKSPREIAINKSVAQNITPSQPTQSRTQSAWLVEKRGDVAWADIIDGKGPPPGIVAAIAPAPVPAPANRGHDISFGTTRLPAPTIPQSTTMFGGTSAFAQKPQAPLTFGGTSAFGPAPSFPVPSTVGSTVGAKAPASIFGPSIFGQKASAGPSFGAGNSAFKAPSSSLPTGGNFAAPPSTQPTFVSGPRPPSPAKSITSSSTFSGTKLNASAQEFVPRFFAPPSAQPEVKAVPKVEEAPKPPPP
ncbi:hypothetical protein FS837_001404, partial [Tulasnella sp. UAMH 9824]